MRKPLLTPPIPTPPAARGREIPGPRTERAPETLKRHAVVEGTITIVKGHLVTVQQSTGTVVVDDTPALNNQFTGKVAVGRRIVAHGYWDAKNFYATIITTAATNP